MSTFFVHFQEPPPTLDDLVRITRVPLQKLDEPCSDEHLRDISSDLPDWRTVAPYLGLRDGEVEDIERDVRTEPEKRRKALQKWNNKYGSKATYKMLTEVLLKLKMANHAEKVCRLLVARDDSQPAHDKNAALSSTVDNTSSSSSTLKSPNNEDPPEIRELERKYDDLVDEVEDSLTRTGTDLSRVKKRIIRLPVSLKHSHGDLLEPEATAAIENTTSISALFNLLHNQHWDFLNCELLCHIVDRFGDPRTKESTEKYLEELRRFRTKTKLKDMIQWTGTRFTKILPVEKHLEVKLGEMWTDRTLEDLEQFRIEFSRRCAINSYAMRFRGGKQGCIAVTFGLPTSVDISALHLQDHHEFLKQHHVLRITAGGSCIIDMTILKVVHVCLFVDTCILITPLFYHSRWLLTRVLQEKRRNNHNYQRGEFR